MTRRKKSLKHTHTEQERRHERTHAHPECVQMVGGADFAAVPPLAVAMGLMTQEEYDALYGKEEKGGE